MTPFQVFFFFFNSHFHSDKFLYFQNKTSILVIFFKCFLLTYFEFKETISTGRGEGEIFNYFGIKKTTKEKKTILTSFFWAIISLIHYLIPSGSLINPVSKEQKVKLKFCINHLQKD